MFDANSFSFQMIGGTALNGRPPYSECTRLAEATSDPEMKVYLLKLGLSWMQAATTARRDEQLLEESHRRLKTLQDLVS